MSCRGASRRGGILRALLILLALAVLAALAVWLIYTRGGKMQDKLHEKVDPLRDKVGLAGAAEPSGTAGASEAGRPDQSSGPNTGAAAPKLPKPKSPYSVAKPPPVAQTSHRVAKGDTFFSIAETYYEDGTLWPIIAEANGLKNADLKEGMLLVIPGR
jgi:nucleoid-associated protein YgaU